MDLYSHVGNKNGFKLQMGFPMAMGFQSEVKGSAIVGNVRSSSGVTVPSMLGHYVQRKTYEDYQSM